MTIAIHEPNTPKECILRGTMLTTIFVQGISDARIVMDTCSKHYVQLFFRDRDPGRVMRTLQINMTLDEWHHIEEELARGVDP